MNHLAVTIEQEFDIIHKSKNKASKLCMPVCLCLLDKGRIPGFQHRLPKSGLGMLQIARPAQRRDTVGLIFARP